MNNKLEKTLETSALFRIYKNLLTDKQKEYLVLYIDEDLSLQEIATNFKISRTAVHDAIQKAISTLNDLERNLNLHQKEVKIQKILQEYKNSESKEVQKILKLLETED